MDIVTLGVPGSLTGLLLVGLAAEPFAPGSPGGSGGEVECTQIIAYDFTAATGPFYPVANQPTFWRDPAWDPVHGTFQAPTAEFPNLTIATNADISGGELTYISDPGSSRAFFGNRDQYALDYEQLINAYGGTRTIYVEVGANFHDLVYDTWDAPSARIFGVHPETAFYQSFALRAVDADGPPSGNIVFYLDYCTGAGTYDTITVHSETRAFANGVHVIRLEMKPSTPVVPGSTTNDDLNPNGEARLYIDGVLEYQNTGLTFRTVPAFVSNINSAFFVGAVALGQAMDPTGGFVGGYTYLDFGYCDEVEIDLGSPPEPGGELPEPVEPLTADLPIGVLRIFGLLTFGEGSPYTEIAFAETTLNDPPEWYGGVKQPWLLGVSTITRELSDSLRGVECSVTVADPDRVFRALATTATLSGAIMEIFLVSDTVRYALGEPYRRFAGRVHDHKALPGFRYEFLLRDVLSEELASLVDAPRIPPGRLTMAQFPGMTKEYENRAIPILLGNVSDESEITPQGVVPPMIVAPQLNFADAWGGLDIDVVAAIISHGALPPGGLWQGYYNTVTNPYVRIPIPASAWGTLITAPGMPGWNYTGVAEDYVDYPLPATPGITHRYTPIFFLASDPNVQAVLDGRIQVAFNPYGLTDEADGSGLYFEDAPDIYEFLIRNWLFPPHWEYGDYNGTPTFLRGYTIVNHASVVTSRERLQAFGSPGGYPVGFLLGRGGQQQTLRHVLTELCSGVLMEQGFDRHGRIMLDVEDVDAVATMNLSDIHDIEAGEFEVWVDHASYKNKAEYVFGYRYLPAVAPLPAPEEGETLPPVGVGAHNDWSAVGTLLHTSAIAANQGRETAALQLENYVVRNSDVAANWAQRNIDRLVGPSPSFDGQRMFRLTTSWQTRWNEGAFRSALEVELGDVIAIDHLEGMGASGFEGQRARILRITDDLQRARIILEGRILYGG